MSSAEAETAGAPRPGSGEPDDRARLLLDELTAELGDAVVGSEVRRGDLWVRVRADAWRRAAEACRDALAMDYFCFLSGIDWMPSTAPNPRAQVSDTLDTGDVDGEAGAEVEDAPDAGSDETATPTDEMQTGYAGGETRFQVFARLYSTRRHQGVTLKADLDDADPRVATIAPVYPGADWNEREAWEMYGFVFDGHPNLNHLYLPGEFEGFPLRKDFPLLAREVKPWPGLVDVEPLPEAPDAGEGGFATEGATS